MFKAGQIANVGAACAKTRQSRHFLCADWVTGLFVERTFDFSAEVGIWDVNIRITNTVYTVYQQYRYEN